MKKNEQSLPQFPKTKIEQMFSNIEGRKVTIPENVYQEFPAFIVVSSARMFYSPLTSSEVSFRLGAQTVFFDFYKELAEWSSNTFGPPEHRGPLGPMEHFMKEVKEVKSEIDPDKQKEEIIDMLFLALDASQRSGMSFPEMCYRAFEKLEKNKKRTWPDWKKADPNKAIEHVREEEEEVVVIAVKDDITPISLRAFMNQAKDEEDWNKRADHIKRLWGGVDNPQFPSFWFPSIVSSGLMNIKIRQWLKEGKTTY